MNILNKEPGVKCICHKKTYMIPLVGLDVSSLEFKAINQMETSKENNYRFVDSSCLLFLIVDNNRQNNFLFTYLTLKGIALIIGPKLG